MNQFSISENAIAPSDAGHKKSPESQGSNVALFEALDNSNKLLPLIKEQRSFQTEALVNSGLLPQMPIDGIDNQGTLSGQYESSSPSARELHESTNPPEAPPINLDSYSDATKQQGRDLAELIRSDGSEKEIMALVQQGLKDGNLEGIVAIADAELQKHDYVFDISLGITTEKMTYEADDASTRPPATIEKSNPRVSFSIFGETDPFPRLTFHLKYDPELDGYKAPHPSAK